MLKGIPKILSPELLKVLCEMGHSDTIVIADGNFPAESIGKESQVIRMDGQGVVEVLEAILELFPLDQYIAQPVTLMERCEGDTADVSIWNKFDEVITHYDNRGVKIIHFKERFDFYKEAKKAYAIVATCETSQYANVILQKGCVLN